MEALLWSFFLGNYLGSMFKYFHHNFKIVMVRDTRGFVVSYERAQNILLLYIELLGTWITITERRTVYFGQLITMS